MSRIVRVFTDGWYMDLSATLAMVVGVILVAKGATRIEAVGVIEMALGALLVACAYTYVQLLARGQWEEDEDG